MNCIQQLALFVENNNPACLGKTRTTLLSKLQLWKYISQQLLCNSLKTADASFYYVNTESNDSIVPLTVLSIDHSAQLSVRSRVRERCHKWKGYHLFFFLQAEQKKKKKKKDEVTME